MKIFLDTNVLASSAGTRGLCNELFEKTISEHELVTCAAVLQKLERALATKFRLPKSIISGFTKLLQREAQFVETDHMPNLAIKDKADIPILACAIAANVDAFVTGGKALLDLEKIEGILILSPRELWKKLNA